jgi:DNA invertase Pin-like site-specific DNA recombinase
MPSKSPSQHRLMEAAAHTSGGYGGVPQSVGKDFAAADKRSAHMAKRKGAGLSHRAVAAEFGVSKSTVHRRVTKATMGRGYTKGGKA